MISEVYILAVSGGVDSVVLLHKLVTQLPTTIRQPADQPPIYIVAHVDHGIRPDSSDDAKFVESLAKKYGVAYASTRLELGPETSEELARSARYKFLFEVMKKHNAEAVITAHHQDDVLETMIVNILRGTGPKGLIGFSRPHILRPFIDKTKLEILDYAKENNLQWREDSTNQDMSYARNHVRIKIMPKLTGDDRQKLLNIREKVVELYLEIDDSTKKLLVQTLIKGELVRARFVVLPYIIQKELMAVWLRLNNVEIDKLMIKRAVISAKTMKPNKKLELSKDATLLIGKRTIVLNVRV